MLSSDALAGEGYLARVGPKPLRFAEAAPRRDAEKVLPPLNMTDLAPTKPAVATETFGPPLPPEPDPEPDQEGIVTEPVATAAPQQMPAAREVTPDSLLQFFTPVKRKDSTVGMQVEFTPPSPIGARGSTATYNSQ